MEYNINDPRDYTPSTDPKLLFAELVKLRHTNRHLLKMVQSSGDIEREVEVLRELSSKRIKTIENLNDELQFFKYGRFKKRMFSLN